MMGKNLSASDGFSTINCMGGRGNNYISSYLAVFKLNTEIKFKAGYKAWNTTHLTS